MYPDVMASQGSVSIITAQWPTTGQVGGDPHCSNESRVRNVWPCGFMQCSFSSMPSPALAPDPASPPFVPGGSDITHMQRSVVFTDLRIWASPTPSAMG